VIYDRVSDCLRNVIVTPISWLRLYCTSPILPETQHASNPWKTCSEADLWALNGHVIKEKVSFNGTVASRPIAEPYKVI